MSLKKTLALALTLALVLSLFPAAAFAADTKFSDVPDWAKADVEYLVAKSLTSGVGDGLFGSTQTLTGNEFFVFADRALKLSGNTGDWDAQKSAALSALKKYGVDTGNAGEAITREEVFYNLALLLGLPDKAAGLVGWTDGDKVSADLKGKVGAFVAAGYVAGTSTGEKVLNPQGKYTRQEYAGIFHRVLGNYINKAGTTKISSLSNTWTTKNITVEKANTLISDGSVDNLIIGAGVGDGDVYLKNVRVKGTLTVFGGGAKSIKILGTSNIANIVIAKIGTPVRIAVQTGATVGAVTINADVTAVITGKVASVTIEEAAAVSLTSAEVSGTVTVEGEAAELTVTTSKVATIDVTEDAAEAEIAVSGSVVTTITNAAPESTLGVADSVVTTVTVSGDDATTAVSGTSTVGTVTVSGDAAAAAVTGTAVVNASAEDLKTATTAVEATIATAAAAVQTEVATVAAAASANAAVDAVDAITSGGGSSGGTSDTSSSGPAPEPGAPAYTAPSPTPTPDTTVPTVIAGAERLTETTAKLTIKSDLAGTAYYKAATIEPTVDELKAASSTAIAAAGEVNPTVTIGATAGKIYVLVVGTNGINSAVKVADYLAYDAPPPPPATIEIVFVYPSAVGTAFTSASPSSYVPLINAATATYSQASASAALAAGNAGTSLTIAAYAKLPGVNLLAGYYLKVGTGADTVLTDDGGATWFSDGTDSYLLLPQIQWATKNAAGDWVKDATIALPAITARNGDKTLATAIANDSYTNPVTSKINSTGEDYIDNFLTAVNAAISTPIATKSGTTTVTIAAAATATANIAIPTGVTLEITGGTLKFDDNKSLSVPDGAKFVVAAAATADFSVATAAAGGFVGNFDVAGTVVLPVAAPTALEFAQAMASPNNVLTAKAETTASVYDSILTKINAKQGTTIVNVSFLQPGGALQIPAARATALATASATAAWASATYSAIPVEATAGIKAALATVTARATATANLSVGNTVVVRAVPGSGIAPSSASPSFANYGVYEFDLLNGNEVVAKWATVTTAQVYVYSGAQVVKATFGTDGYSSENAVAVDLTDPQFINSAILNNTSTGLRAWYIKLSLFQPVAGS
ncbi:MAG: hypothetical protein LBN97_06095 [Oscillospiraceae bacterium]|jgi:hypothetical protein|nr:hypothetical protein [Oscillospiraceae bacterium]